MTARSPTSSLTILLFETGAQGSYMPLYVYSSQDDQGGSKKY